MTNQTLQILLATYPLEGHISAAAPLARALVDSGHSVRWYTAEHFEPAVRRSGAVLVPMGSDALPADLAGRPAPTPPRGRLARIRWAVTESFLGPSAAQFEELRAALEQHPADVVVTDFAVTGAAMLHDSGGPPWTSFGLTPLMTPGPGLAPFGPGIPPGFTRMARLRNRAMTWLSNALIVRPMITFDNRIRAECGVEPASRPFVYPSPDLHLQLGVASLEYPRPPMPNVHFVGAMARPMRSVDLPPWWPELIREQRPVVHVTQGTVMDRDGELLHPTIDALAEEDVLVVAATGRFELPGPLPSNVRTATYLPHDQLLPHLSVMVTNGGYGGVQQSLQHGVPLVVAGDGQDKAEVAARVAWSGAGINLRTGTPSAQQVGDAVRTVLDDPGYARAAQRIAAEFAAHDAAAESVTLIEDLAVRGHHLDKHWSEVS